MGPCYNITAPQFQLGEVLLVKTQDVVFRFTLCLCVNLYYVKHLGLEDEECLCCLFFDVSKGYFQYTQATEVTKNSVEIKVYIVVNFVCLLS